VNVSIAREGIGGEDLMMQMDERRGSAISVSILVVDDEDMVRRAVSYRLQMAGFQVYQAGNGQDAVELFRQHQAVITGVLLDVLMPGLDGPMTLAQIKEVNPGVPICFLTGFSDGYSVDDLLQSGASYVFLKGSLDWDALVEFYRRAALPACA
jgi:CheY-like chemotaxis protein